MTKHFVLTTVILASLVSSCSAGDQSFETRRQFAIQSAKGQLASTKNEVRAKWEKEILSSLATTDAKTINNPRVASAIFGNGKGDTYGIFVFWIENVPSVDGLEFRYSAEKTPAIIPIPDPDLKQMRDVVKDTIVFGSEYEWKEPTELSKSFPDITNATQLKVRLLRANAPVTDWFPAEFYKDGRWVSAAPKNQ